MTEKIGVIGTPGKWSTEALADALEARTGYRQVIDMARVTLDLGTRALVCDGMDLCALDGLVVKKIAETYSPDALDRLEMLRVAEAMGVKVFSPATAICNPASMLRSSALSVLLAAAAASEAASSSAVEREVATPSTSTSPAKDSTMARTSGATLRQWLQVGAK